MLHQLVLFGRPYLILTVKDVTGIWIKTTELNRQVDENMDILNFVDLITLKLPHLPKYIYMFLSYLILLC